MEKQVTGHKDRTSENLLQLFQISVCVRLEELRYFRMGAQDNILAFHYGANFRRLLEHLADNGLDALDVRGAFAGWARNTKASLQALLHPLSGNRYETKVIKLQDFVRRSIGAHCLFQRLHHL